MKVLFFIESLHCGGKERRAAELIHYLKRSGNFEIILVLTEKEIHYNLIDDLNIETEILKRKGLKYDPRLFFKFYECCIKHKPDVIHAWGKMTTFYAIPVKVLCGIPLLSNLIADSNKVFMRRFCDRFFLAVDIHFSDLILSNSQAGLDAYNIHNSKTVVIVNGVRTERFSKEYDKIEIKKKLGISTEYVLVMVASFSKYKDYDLFIDLASRLAKLRSDVTLVGVGDGDDWLRITYRIKNENIKNVLLTGAVSEIEPLIAAADIGLLCTFSEGISNSILEYMALGKPVISTDLTGGSKEIIVDGETGYCIERNLDILTECVIALLDDAKLRKAMGERGRERILSDFNIEKMGNKYELIYDKLVSDGKR